MRKSKLMNWVVKPAMNDGYGHYTSGLTLTEFYEKNFIFKKVLNIADYYNMSTYDTYYEQYYDGTPFPMTNYYPLFSPMIILSVDSDGNFWTFDSFWNNLVNWTDWDGTELPDVNDPNAIRTFITTKWQPYV